jgi:hypothetical protein
LEGAEGSRIVVGAEVVAIDWTRTDRTTPALGGTDGWQTGAWWGRLGLGVAELSAAW